MVKYHASSLPTISFSSMVGMDELNDVKMFVAYEEKNKHVRWSSNEVTV